MLKEEYKKIKVIGFGEAGYNCLKKLIKENINKETSFIEISGYGADINNFKYDVGNLEDAVDTKTLLIGEKTLKGLGDITFSYENRKVIIEEVMKESGEELRAFLRMELKNTNVVLFISPIRNIKTDLIVPLIIEGIKKLGIIVIELVERNSIFMAEKRKPEMEKLEKELTKSSYKTIIVDIDKEENIPIIKQYEKIYDRICDIIVEMINKKTFKKEEIEKPNNLINEFWYCKDDINN